MNSEETSICSYRQEIFLGNTRTSKMPKLLNSVLVFCIIFLFSNLASAETYFLKIEQDDEKGQETFLQTCTPKTSPCTFMMPVTLPKGGTKNIAVVMRFKESPYIYLQFYWDQVLLGDDHSGEGHYTILAGSSDVKVEPRIIRLYVPVPPEKKPESSQPVLKFSDELIATLKVVATITSKP